MTTASKIALVTGATRGIGLETVRQLAQAGVHALLAGRNRDRAVAAALDLQSQGLPVEAIVLDVTDPATIAAAAAEVERRHGRLDILVNNAGIFIEDVEKGATGQSLDLWRTTFATNLFGMVETTQAFLLLLRKSPAGRIVNLSSELASLSRHQDPSSSIHGFIGAPAYSASKSAVNAWTVHLALALADTGIKVNAADPGYVKTDMNAGEGVLSVTEGARTSVRLALLGDDGPTGGYFHLDEALPW
jgi:NAD(P)-dependent dehydrogenase (short-subunit alcohol dehydrogenase family)